MKYNKVIAVVFTIWCYGNLSAATFSDSVFYGFYVAGNMDGWKTELYELGNKLTVLSSFSEIERVTFAQYGYAGYLVGQNQKKEASVVLTQMETNIKRLRKMQPQNMNIQALQASWYGLKIMLRPWKAPVYGKKSMDLIEDAVSKASSNAYVFYEKANMVYSMPSFLGGGVKNAIPVLEKAIAMMDTNPGFAKNSWIYLMANSNLVNWYILVNKEKKARLFAEKIMRYEPGFTRLPATILSN